MAIPLSVAPCKVTGRFLRGARDGTDEDRDVDGLPVSGLQISIQATVSVIRNTNIEPPAFVSLEPIVVFTGSDGRMIGFSDDDDGIMVIASNGDGIEPSGSWYYVATVTGDGWPTQRIPFVAPANGTFDLVKDAGLPLDISAAIPELQRLRNELQAKIDEYQSNAPGVLS